MQDSLLQPTGTECAQPVLSIIGKIVRMFGISEHSYCINSDPQRLQNRRMELGANSLPMRRPVFEELLFLLRLEAWRGTDF